MLEKLNQVEYETAQLAALGCTQKETAYALKMNRCKVNNIMRGVHRKLGTDEHTLPRVFIGEKHHIPDIAEPLRHYDFFGPSVWLKANAVVAILLVLSLEFFNTTALRVRRAARVRRAETEYVFAYEMEG